MSFSCSYLREWPRVSHLERFKQAERELAAERQFREAHEASFRATLRRAFTLAGLGPEATPEECHEVLAAIQALTDNLGVKVADEIRCEEKARWLVESGRCPYCGGAPHD